MPSDKDIEKRLQALGRGIDERTGANEVQPTSVAANAGEMPEQFGSRRRNLALAAAAALVIMVGLVGLLQLGDNGSDTTVGEVPETTAPGPTTTSNVGDSPGLEIATPPFPILTLGPEDLPTFETSGDHGITLGPGPDDAGAGKEYLEREGDNRQLVTVTARRGSNADAARESIDEADGWIPVGVGGHLGAFKSFGIDPDSGDTNGAVLHWELGDDILATLRTTRTADQAEVVGLAERLEPLSPDSRYSISLQVEGLGVAARLNAAASMVCISGPEEGVEACVGEAENTVIHSGFTIGGLVAGDADQVTLNGPNGNLVELPTYPTPSANHRMFAFRRRSFDTHTYTIAADPNGEVVASSVVVGTDPRLDVLPVRSSLSEVFGGDYIWSSVEDFVLVADVVMVGTVRGFSSRSSSTRGEMTFIDRDALVEATHVAKGDLSDGDVVAVQTRHLVQEEAGAYGGLANNLMPWLEIGDDVVVFAKELTDSETGETYLQPLDPSLGHLKLGEHSDYGGAQDMEYAEIVSGSFAAEIAASDVDGASSLLDAAVATVAAGESPPPERRPVPGSDTFVWEFPTASGWHNIDTGPVPPSPTSSVTWTGSELVVATSTRLFAWNAQTGQWRELGGPPFVGRIVAIAAMGDSVMVVGEWEGERLSASVRLPTGAWTDHGQAPGTARALSPNRMPSMLWTGQRLLVATWGAQFDPATGIWSELERPAQFNSIFAATYTNPVWTGDQLVVHSPNPEAGFGYNADGSPSGELSIIGPDLVAPTGLIDDTLGVRMGDEALYLNGAGVTAAYSPTTDSWRLLESVPAFERSEGCPTYLVGLDDTAAAWPCWSSEGPVYLTDEGWEPIEGGPEIRCCIDQWTQVNGALLIWSSSTDTTNDPNAPHVNAKLWVPPEP